MLRYCILVQFHTLSCINEVDLLLPLAILETFTRLRQRIHDSLQGI